MASSAMRTYLQIGMVEIDTRRLSRGHIIRADYYIDLDQIADLVLRWMHQGEYLLQYTIPAEAILAEIRV
jgi:hypothetical protein